jgi:hypothetical protein
MKRIFVAVVTVAFIAGLAPASAAGARVGGGGVHAGGANGAGIRGPRPRAEPLPQIPNMQNRIPAPLSTPAQPPVINGPVGPSGMPAMGNGLR